MLETPQIEPTAEGIGHAIADKHPIVPLRQRFYAWTKDEVLQLFEDLENAINDNSNEDYFLGLVVVIQKGHSRPEVLDGQQRLATCVMLLAAIRDHLLKDQPKSAAKIERDYLIDYDLRAKEEVPRLRLNVDDASFFLDAVLRRPDDAKRLAITKLHPRKDIRKESNRNILAAAKLAYERVQTIIKGVAESHQEERLLKWESYIRNSAKVIWFAVPDRDHAFKVFETLNDRGLDLSQSDLLKNHLFDCAPDKYTEIHHSWAKMLGALETVAKKDVAVTYIRHLWISTNGPTREKQLYSSIKTKIKGEAAAVDFAAKLADRANDYAAMFNPDHEFWSKLGTVAKKDVSSLILFKAERIRPLILAVMEEFTDAELKKALRLFVAWSVRYIVSGGVAGTIERKYGELSKAVSDKNVKTARDLVKQMGSSIASDADFEADFSLAKSSQKPLSRYYLRVLESVKRGEVDDSALAVDENEEKANLEHILPENPEAGWKINTPAKQAVANDYWTRIGNLALMRKKLNEQTANKVFPEKKKFYAQEKALHLTYQLTKYGDIWWTAEIEDRQKELAKLAVKAWPIRIA